MQALGAMILSGGGSRRMGQDKAGLDWLELRKPEGELLRASPAGTLEVEKVFPEAA